MTVARDPQPRSRLYQRLVVGLAVAVTIFAAGVALWMYWLASV